MVVKDFVPLWCHCSAPFCMCTLPHHQSPHSPTDGWREFQNILSGRQPPHHCGATLEKRRKSNWKRRKQNWINSGIQLCVSFRTFSIHVFVVQLRHKLQVFSSEGFFQRNKTPYTYAHTWALLGSFIWSWMHYRKWFSQCNMPFLDSFLQWWDQQQYYWWWPRPLANCFTTGTEVNTHAVYIML